MPYIFGSSTQTSSGPVTVVGTTTASFPLSDAVLSNGAALVASSGVFPQRITTEPVYVIQPEIGSIVAVLFGSDNRSIIVSNAVAVKKYDFSGSLVFSTNSTQAFGLQRAGTDLIAVGQNNATAVATFLSESNGALSLRSAPSVASRRVLLRVPNATAADTYWFYGGSTGSTEFSLTTGLATRQLTFPASANTLFAISGTFDGIPSLYATFTSGSDQWIVRYRESTLAELGRWVFGSAYVNNTLPGGSVGTELWVDDSTGKMYVRNQNSIAIDVIPAAASASATAVAGGATRAWWGGDPALWGPSFPPVGGGAQCQSFMDISSDRRYAMTTTTDRANILSSRGVIVRNITTQRARWSVTMSSGTLTKIIVPGFLNSGYGSTPVSGTAQNGTLTDYRRARCYYQRLGTDGSRVEFTPNDDLSVPLVAAGTLQVDVDFNDPLGVPGSPQPYIVSGIQIQWV